MLEPWGGASAVPAELEKFCAAAYEYAAELNSWGTRLAGRETLAYPVFAIRCLAGLWEQQAGTVARIARDFTAADMAAMPSPATESVVATARAQLGYREGRNNDTRFGRWYGLNHEAWCAMFVSWVFAKAGTPLPRIQGRKGFARVAEGFRWGRATGHLARAPRVGDIFLISHDGSRGHTGIVVAVNADGTITTIEGNTNVNGSRNGDGVYRRTRRLSSINAGFLRVDTPVDSADRWKGPNMFPGVRRKKSTKRSVVKNRRPRASR